MRVWRSIALLALLVSAPAAASPLDGLWLTDDRRGVVRIGACGPQLCGWIVRVLDRGPNVPTRDVNNPDAALRSRAILGLQVLTGFAPGADGYTGGQAYDPKTGRSYRASLSLAGSGALNVTGCVLVFCRTLVWTRVR